jgi:MFS family permease
VVAVTVVGASAAQVSILATITAVTIALTALPIGAHVEFRRKRPIMIASDVTRCLAAASVPIAAALGGLSFAQLCVVAMVNAVGVIAFSTAAGSHLRNLVPREMLVDANGRLQASQWRYGLLMGVPSLGGFLGARLGTRVIRSWGAVRAIFGASVLRTPWYFLTPLARPGVGGLILCGVAFAAGLVFSSLSNSTMSGYRQLVTPAALQARTAALWSFATVATAPLFVLAGAALVTAVQPRTALFVTAALTTLSVALLPREERSAPAPVPTPAPAPAPVAKSVDDAGAVA